MVQGFRAKIIALFNPFFRAVAKQKYSDPALSPKRLSEFHKLQAENHLLHLQIEQLKDIIQHQQGLEAISEELFKTDANDSKCLLYGLALEAIPGKVIYRDPSHWDSFVWVDVGYKTNKKLGREAISLNSPVIIGDCIVGIIDFVGEKQSRVRLISDSKLHPSVRTVRGTQQKRTLIKLLDHTQSVLKNEPGFFKNKEEERQLLRVFDYIKNKVTVVKNDLYYAKGILEGAVKHGGRNQCCILKGSGFNYDFPDEEGVAKDLKTGQIQGNIQYYYNQLEPLIKEGDLLVTTGMDGVFPKGFKVATVTKIHPLREGNYTYEIEALSLIPHLEELQTVFIIPALSFKFDEIP